MMVIRLILMLRVFELGIMCVLCVFVFLMFRVVFGIEELVYIYLI